VNIKSTSWLAIAVVTLCMAGNALAATVYTNRAEFEAALLSFTVEDFESTTAFGIPDFPNGTYSLALTDFSLSSTDKVIKILDEPHSGSHNTSSGTGDSQFLYLDTDLGLQGSTTVISFYNPVDAFGFDYTGVYESNTASTVSIFRVTIGSDEFELQLNNPEATPRFWGVLGLGSSFTNITLYTSVDSGYGVDDVIFGSAVPLPPAIWLFGSGLLVLVGGTRKGKAHS